MAEESDGVVVASAVLEEGEGGLEELALVGCELGVEDVGVGKPVVKGENIRGHGRVSWRVNTSRISAGYGSFQEKAKNHSVVVVGAAVGDVAEETDEGVAAVAVVGGGVVAVGTGHAGALVAVFFCSR